MMKYWTSRRGLVLILLLCMCGTARFVCAEDEVENKDEAVNGFGAHTVLGGRFSGDVQEYFADVLLDPWELDEGVFLLDLRGSAVESQEQEVNAGFVWRNLLADNKIIAGLNAFYDNRWTENDNRFDQVGGGIEVFSTILDLRANYYYPLEDEESLGAPVDGMVRYEEALDGFDVELGGWIPFLQEKAQTGLFVGYYDFSSDVDEDLSGMRVRFESRIHPRLTIDAQWFEDEELNDTEYFVGFRVHIPLGSVPEGRWRVAGAPLESRLYDMVIRDFRVRTRETGPVPVAVSQPVETEQARYYGAPPPEEREPICELDSEGNVVCR